MDIIYSNHVIPEKLPLHSVFLAGPTPRDKETPSWRPEALSILSTHNFNGAVFVPEWSIRPDKVDYDAQVEWEHEGLTRAYWILFWIPRELKTMPAFTTNVDLEDLPILVRCFMVVQMMHPKTGIWIGITRK